MVAAMMVYSCTADTADETIPDDDQENTEEITGGGSGNEDESEDGTDDETGDGSEDENGGNTGDGSGDENSGSDGSGNQDDNTGSNDGEPKVGDTDSEGYTLIWQDEFDGSGLDTSKWTAELNGNGNGNSELEYYRAANVTTTTIDDKSCLQITARRESYGWASFTSGRINTKGNCQFTYGKVEASIRMPKTANGLWPAFWLLGADIDTNSWPACGEIDIVEMGNGTGISSGTTETYMNGACHWGYYIDGSYPSYAVHSNAPYSVQDGEFHLFTLIWDKDNIKMYLDRDVYPSVSPYYAMAITQTADDSGWDVGLYFHKDYYILLNLAVGGSFMGIYDASGITALPSDGSEAYMYVDYVRVYQK